MRIDNNKLDAQVERLDRIREQSAGVQRFMKASRHIGEDNALNGPRWVIPGLLQEGQTAICAGPPGTGKSFVILDWLARVVRGLDFCGKPVMQGGVVYTTGEGQTGLAKRIAAVATEFALSDRQPFLYIRIMPRLLDVQDTKDFIAAVKLQTADWAVPIRVMAFDTFNRAIVGGSESEGKDVARLLDADGRIKDAFTCATLYAHHPGKAEGNDLRGHSSLMGDTDVNAVFCGASGTRTIEIRKQKDDEGGGVFGYSLRKIELGSHEKTGEIVTSCLVDWVDGEIARSVRSAGKPWPRGLTLLHDIITAAVLESGIDHRPDGNGPAVKAVPLEDIRALHKRQFLGSGDGDRTAAERQAFTRNIKRARDMRLIAGEAVGGREIIWTTTKQLLTVTGTA